MKDTALDVSYKKFQKQIQCPHIQVVYSHDTFQKVDSQTWVMGVDHFLGRLV